MGKLCAFEHAGKRLRGFDRGGSYEDGLAFFVAFLDTVDHSVEFFTAGLEDLVVGIFPLVVAVCRNGKNVEIVDVVEFRRFRFRGSGHATEFFVEAEVILNRDGCVSLGLSLDLYAFLGFDSLVEAVGPTTSGHFTTGVFVNDNDLVVFDHVFVVFLIKAVGLEKLGDGMYAGALGIHAGLDFFLLGDALFLTEFEVGVDVGEGFGKVGDDEGFGLVG